MQDRRSHTKTHIRSGSPTSVISGMVHFRSKALAKTILKILGSKAARQQRLRLKYYRVFTFCTLMECEVEQ